MGWHPVVGAKMGKMGPQYSHSKNPAANRGKRRGEERCLLVQVGCLVALIEF